MEPDLTLLITSRPALEAACSRWLRGMSVQAIENVTALRNLFSRVGQKLPVDGKLPKSTVKTFGAEILRTLDAADYVFDKRVDVRESLSGGISIGIHGLYAYSPKPDTMAFRAISASVSRREVLVSEVDLDATTCTHAIASHIIRSRMGLREAVTELLGAAIVATTIDRAIQTAGDMMVATKYGVALGTFQPEATVAFPTFGNPMDLGIVKSHGNAEISFAGPTKNPANHFVLKTFISGEMVTDQKASLWREASNWARRYRETIYSDFQSDSYAAFIKSGLGDPANSAEVESMHRDARMIFRSAAWGQFMAKNHVSLKYSAANEPAMPEHFSRLTPFAPKRVNRGAVIS